MKTDKAPEGVGKFLPVLRALRELQRVSEEQQVGVLRSGAGCATAEPEKYRKNLIISIDGPCASGKTTLAAWLQENVQCNVFHMDDFFLQAFQRTRERLSAPGENTDHERFLREVLEPLKRGETVEYRRFDCHSMSMQPAVRIPIAEISVVEGSYSQHESLRPYYDLTVCLDISEKIQRERILARNGPDAAQRFFDRWIPLEKAYFEKFRIRERADLVVKTDAIE